MEKVKAKKEEVTEGTEKKELTSKELRDQEREACNREIAAVLGKYGCELTAQMILSPSRGMIPQVFIIDAQSSV